MKRFGLIGKKLGHSFSPQIHAMLGDYEYRLYELESEELIPDFIKTSGLDGFNVTIPYKQAVIPYLDELTPAASEIGAVNTVYRRDGRLIGDNTDCVGFAYTVASSGADVRGKKTLVIGNGGASKAVCHALRAADADVHILTHKENTAEGIKPYLDSRIIVNTTPVGMFPKNGEMPVDISLFGECEYVFDIIFNPAKTALMLEAKKRGIPCRNGLPMLVSQAKRAAELFMECEIADSENERIIREISGKEENIILVGMPGCGKTTVGKLIAERLGKGFIDTDDEIAAQGKTPEEIITESGEAAFRRVESNAVAEAGKKCGFVIATGGGVVTVAENYAPLAQNGRIVFINRDISSLARDGRPLSRGDGALEKLFSARLPLYRAFADTETDGNMSAAEVAENIIKELEK